MKNVKFRGKRRIPRLKFRGKTQIPRLGSKFRGPRKTVGPIDQPCSFYVRAIRGCKDFNRNICMLPLLALSLTRNCVEQACPTFLARGPNDKFRQSWRARHIGLLTKKDKTIKCAYHMQVMYFMPCTDPDLVRGLALSLLAQTIYICSNSRSCCCKYARKRFIGTERSGFGLDIFHDGKQLLTTVATTKKRNISKSKSHLIRSCFFRNIIGIKCK